MGLADLHIHTTYSWDGTCTVSAVLKRVVENTTLAVIAITDHDEITGALRAVEMAPAYGLEAVPGSEISTADGHLLGLWLKDNIPAGLPLAETVLRIGEQSGLAIAAHPMAPGAPSLTQAALRLALQDADVRRVLIGVECFNAGLIYGRSNLAAAELCSELGLAPVGNSDSHLVWTIGQGATEFPGVTAAALRRALENRNTRVIRGPRSSVFNVVGSWAPRYLLRRAGWVADNLTPQAPIRLSRFVSAR
jgi:hypothetical protein